MNGWRTALWATAFLFCGLSAAWPADDQREDPEVLLESAKHKALVDGDLKAAIEICERIVAQPNGDRATSAQALVHIGRCYEKLGKAEARKAYERVVSEYADQAEAVSAANARLALLQRESESEESAGVELQEVWSFPGLGELSVWAISRDGRYFAFTDPETRDLMVRDLTTGEDRRLAEATAGRFLYVRASISPDNKWVVYTEYGVGEWSELRIVGIDGSRDRVLCANEEKNAISLLWGWDPESRYVLATFHDPGAAAQGPATCRIVAVSVADGSIKLLKEVTKRILGSSCPRFSPDGRYVTYHRKTDEDSNADIFLIPLDGGEEIHLIEHPANDLVLGWIPNSQILLFLSNRGGEGYHAWMTQVVDGRPDGVPRRVTKGVVSTRWCASAGPVRTPTGGWAFFYAELGQRAYAYSGYLATLDADTGKLLSEPMPVSQRGPGREITESPAFSHDGKYLAYYVAPGPKQSPKGPWFGPGNIVIRSLEAGVERVITLSPKLSNGGVSSFLHWAPDGRSILIYGCAETGRRGIHRVDTETGKLDPVVLNSLTTTDWQLAWPPLDGPAPEREEEEDTVSYGELSPDGKTLYFSRVHYDPTAPTSRRRTQGRIVARDLETGQEREVNRLPDGVYDYLNLGVSPDGEHLVVAREGVLEIVPAAGGEPRQLLAFQKEPTHSVRWSIAWTPDSRYVLFVKVGQGRFELWRIAADGGQPERIDELRAALGTGIIVGLKVSPKGGQLAFQAFRYIRQGRIQMMQIAVSDEIAKEMCTANLRKIGKAIDQYKNDHGDVPDGFADLYPEYLQDRNLLLCPADQTGGKPLEGAKDPTMYCSYAYRFGPGTEGVSGLNVALPVDFPAREGMTWKDARKLQLEYFGPVVPIVQCRHHSQRMFLGYSGDIYEAEYWESSPRAGVGLLNQLQSAMKTDHDTWAQRYDMQRFHCLVEDEAALTDLLKTHLKAHSEDEAAQESLAELPRLRFPSCSYDDAEEDTEGEVLLGSNDLDLIHGNKGGANQVVGIRFPDVPVPQGARIKRAYLQLTAYPEEPGSEKTDLVLHAELAANAELFAKVKHNITSRRKTTASVKWSPEPWIVGGERSEKQRTPDLSSLIQEVVDQPDWKKGNALVLTITGSGRRWAESWDGSWSGTPMLYVEH